MKIHQMQITRDELEDRLLLRVSTTENSEFRFWLTRRFVKQLWVLLLKMLEWDRAVQQQLDTGMRQTVMQIQHEGYAQQGDFSKGFEEVQRTLPLGPTPVLLTRGKGTRRDDGLQVLSLQPEQGQGLDMTLDARLLHIFAKLVRDAAAHPDWDLNLALGEPAGEPAAAVAPARKLN
jgi:hypothetical protein